DADTVLWQAVPSGQGLNPPSHQEFRQAYASDWEQHPRTAGFAKGFGIQLALWILQNSQPSKPYSGQDLAWDISPMPGQNGSPWSDGVVAVLARLGYGPAWARQQVENIGYATQPYDLQGKPNMDAYLGEMIGVGTGAVLPIFGGEAADQAKRAIRSAAEGVAEGKEETTKARRDFIWDGPLANTGSVGNMTLARGLATAGPQELLEAAQEAGYAAYSAARESGDTVMVAASKAKEAIRGIKIKS